MMVFNSIVYDDGFAVTWSPEMVGNVIKNVANVKIVPADTAEQAYINGAQKYFKRAYWGNPGIRQPMMPRFDAIQHQRFIRPDVVPQIPVERHFAAAYGDYVAHLRSVENVVEFLREFPWGIITETNSESEALKELNFFFLKRFMGYGAYLQEAVPMIRELPADEIAETGFSSWWQRQQPSIPAHLPPLPAPRQVVEIVPEDQRRKRNGNK